LGFGSEPLLGLAKCGNRSALGRLLDRHRIRLARLAKQQVGRRLRGKLDVDDLLQEVSLKAHRDIRGFHGSSEGEFRSWLRQLLATTVANQVRHYFGTRGRDPRRERPISAAWESSSNAAGQNLLASQTSPSQRASRRERAALLADALDNIPESYRRVIVLRQIEGHSFSEVARQMQRSEDSVKNLWLRALARLRRELEGLQ